MTDDETPTPTTREAAGDDAQVKAIAFAWMHHLGYNDEQIVLGEQQTHDNSGCEFEYPNWDCQYESGESRHPELDNLAVATDMANVALETVAALAVPAGKAEARIATLEAVIREVRDSAQQGLADCDDDYDMSAVWVCDTLSKVFVTDTPVAGKAEAPGRAVVIAAVEDAAFGDRAGASARIADAVLALFPPVAGKAEAARDWQDGRREALLELAEELDGVSLLWLDRAKIPRVELVEMIRRRVEDFDSLVPVASKAVQGEGE